MTVVVDASVAARWVLEQEGSTRAGAIRTQGGLIAPSLIAAEIGSAIWKAVRRNAVSIANALEAMEAALLPFEMLIPAEELRRRALALAVELDHPIYDCFYLALAERENVPLISADKKLIAIGKRVKGIELRVL
jgi:predicted nucleic acid-binding protein